MKQFKYFLFLFFIFLTVPVHVSASDTGREHPYSFLKERNYTLYEKEDPARFVSSSQSFATLRKSDQSAEKQAVNKIYQALLRCDTVVDLSEFHLLYSDRMASGLLDQAFEKDLYLFNTLANISNFSGNSDFCSCYTVGKYIDSFEFNYKDLSPDQLKTQYRQLRSRVQSIRNRLDLEGKPKEEIVLEVHDYIALHTDYDTRKNPARTSYSAYGALLKGKAVCSGYSAAGELLLESYGIPVELAVSDRMDHVWTLVKLGKNWYHMDITWDDPYPKKKNYVAYWFFLKTDSEFRHHKKSDHYKWDSEGIRCTSSRYSHIPLSDNRSLFHKGNFWYQDVKKKKDGTHIYKKYNFRFTASAPVASSHLPFIRYRDRIYYASSSRKISSFLLNGTKKKKITTVSRQKKARITSMKISNQTLSYTFKVNGKKKKGRRSLS